MAKPANHDPSASIAPESEPDPEPIVIDPIDPDPDTPGSQVPDPDTPCSQVPDPDTPVSSVGVPVVVGEESLEDF